MFVLAYRAIDKKGKSAMLAWIWEIGRYIAAWGGVVLIIWFWYWLFANIGTF